MDRDSLAIRERGGKEKLKEKNGDEKHGRIPNLHFYIGREWCPFTLTGLVCSRFEVCALCQVDGGEDKGASLNVRFRFV